MSIANEYREILKQIDAWPPERKVSLAREILDSVESVLQANPKPKRDTLSRALGMARVEGTTPPDDAEVERILDERRMEKYGQ
jgi:hypothetical protein